MQIITAPPTIFSARLNSPAWNVVEKEWLVPGGADDLSAGSRRLVRRTLPRQPLWAGLTGHEKVGVWLLTCRTAYYCNEYISTSLISTFQVLHQHISTFAHFNEHFSTSAHQHILVSSLAHQYCVDYGHTMPFVDAMSTSTVLTDFILKYHEHINII